MLHALGKKTMEESDTPLGKLHANLLGVGDKIPVVLVSTGSYAPVHRMHVEVFEAAKRWLEKHHNFAVVAGYMSPSHDHYVGSKMRRQGVAHIPISHRVAMCRLSLQGSDWLEVSEWEARQRNFVDFPDVTLAHEAFLKRKLQKEAPGVVVMYLCGADHAVRCGLLNGITDSIPVVAVARPGYTDHMTKHKLTDGKCYFVELETEDVSSTAIRKRLAASQGVEDLTGAAVSHYLFQHDLHKLFASRP